MINLLKKTFNIKPKVPISYLTIDFLLGKSYPVSVWHEHLVKIENEGVVDEFLIQNKNFSLSNKENITITMKMVS